MRYSILALLFLISVTLGAQEIKENPETGFYESQGVIELNEITQDKLFDGALEWIALNYKSANDVIQLKEKELGKIVVKGKYGVILFAKEKGTISHTLILEFKEGKFRYTYSGFSYYDRYSGENTFEEEKSEFIISKTEELINLSIEDMTNYIKKQEKNSDW